MSGLRDLPQAEIFINDEDHPNNYSFHFDGAVRALQSWETENVKKMFALSEEGLRTYLQAMQGSANRFHEQMVIFHKARLDAAEIILNKNYGPI